MWRFRSYISGMDTWITRAIGILRHRVLILAAAYLAISS
jgi:hypothetical protein